jgi:hypothetical protein
MSGAMVLVGWMPVEDRFLGFVPGHSSWAGDFERFAQMHPAGVRFEAEPDGVRAMESLLRLCHAQGIHVKDYGEPSGDLRRLRAACKPLRGTTLDYSGSRISSRREYFYNSQHLNADGASAFSLRLADRLALNPPFGRLARPRPEGSSRP